MNSAELDIRIDSLLEREKENSLENKNQLSTVELTLINSFKRSIWNELTRKRYSQVIDIFLKNLREGRKLSDLNLEDFHHYNKEYLSKKSLSTQVLSMSALKKFFNTLKKKGYIKEVPLPEDKLPKPNKTAFASKVPDLSSIKRLIECAKIERDKILIEFLYKTGLRISEAVSANFRDVKLVNGAVSFYVIGKGKKERVIIIERDLYDRIINLKGYVKGGPLFRRKKGDVSKGVTARSVQLLLSELSQKAKLIQPITPHLLRHAFATHLKEKNVSLDDLQEALGHASIATTVIYTKSAKREFCGLSIEL